MARAELIGRSWLWRELRVSLPEEGESTVLYSGRGLGYETVYVDDEVAERMPNMSLNPFHFVPVFVFPIGRRRLGVVEVRVWPWTRIRSFHLVIDGEVIYAEGERSQAYLPPAWLEEVRRRWEATGKASDVVTRKLSDLLQRPPGEGVGRPGKDDGRRGAKEG